jgi:hypothetical protein
MDKRVITAYGKYSNFMSDPVSYKINLGA